MRLEDNMMPILTGLVFAVVLGTTVQNSDDLMKAFGAADQMQATDDVFFVRSGTNANLDVLANDAVQNAVSIPQIQIVANPTCGELVSDANGLTYINSESCEGAVQFTYCLSQDQSCEAAQVSLNVRPAPVAVADAYLPEVGGLVPLNSKPSTTEAPAVGSATDTQAAPLSAFVVSLDVEGAIPNNKRDNLLKYFNALDASALTKSPNGDAALLADLSPSSVPVSAIRSARFLVDYGSDGFNFGSDQPSGEMESSNAADHVPAQKPVMVEIELSAS